jgi:6-pyruvoyltetrahydropterin/6-carboxytetrahydropterin synthase
MIHITRRERFNAAHKLYNKAWTEAENEAVFGKCANANWHGHNFELFVTVKGEVNPETAFVVNLKDLSKVIREQIIDRVDHRNLNVDVDFMQNIMPSTENLAMAIWRELEPAVVGMGAQLHCIKLVETENNYVEYFGE